MIRITTIRNKIGISTYLLRDEEVYIVATEDMGDAHRLPTYKNRLINEMKQVFRCLDNHCLDKHDHIGEISRRPEIQYAPESRGG